jgi:hypothetical protein
MSLSSLATIQHTSGDGFEFLLSKPQRSGLFVKGTPKLTQEFLAELFTQRGSVRYDPSYGSSFLRDIRGGNASAIDEFRSALHRGIREVLDAMRGRLRPEDTPDEIPAEVTVTALEQQWDCVQVSLLFQSLAGSYQSIQLPVDLNEMKETPR